MRVVEQGGLRPAHPQAVQEHRELPGHHRPLLGVLASPGGYLLSVATQVRIGAEGSKDVVGTAHQELTLTSRRPPWRCVFGGLSPDRSVAGTSPRYAWQHENGPDYSRERAIRFTINATEP